MKRFWTAARVTAEAGGHAILLDDRPLRTPAKRPLAVPTAALARAIAAEWDGQAEEVRPETMPLTRAANSALDKVAPEAAAVVAMLAAYGETDLLCHPAEAPEALVRRQAAEWGPVRDWAAGLGIRLIPAPGVMPVPQPEESLAALRTRLAGFAPFPLTALHDLITLSGSALLGLAVAEGHLAAEDGWRLSRLDEDWQISQWGEDAEAAEAAARRRADFLTARRLLDLLA